MNKCSGNTGLSSSNMSGPLVASSTASGSASQLRLRGMLTQSMIKPFKSFNVKSGQNDNLLDGYLGVIDQFGTYPIPQPSSHHPIQQFGAHHLQRAGLLNTGNICCHLSIVLCFHRLGLLKFMEDDLIELNGNVLDWSAFLMQRILKALPSSNAFSIQNFCTAWNNDGKLPQLQAWDDISIVDALTTQLPFRGINNIPALSRYFLRYTCPACGHVENDCNDRPFQTVPTLTLLPGSVPISAERLLLVMMRDPVQTRCICGQAVVASWRTKPGKATLLFIARNTTGQGIARTRLIPRPPSGDVPGIMGELVSVVSRSGGIRQGHYFSYHQVGGRWFKNDDAHAIREVNHHPFNPSGPREDVVMLCYLNNV